jgi:hypothetical protein
MREQEIKVKMTLLVNRWGYGTWTLQPAFPSRTTDGCPVLVPFGEPEEFRTKKELDVRLKEIKEGQRRA